MNAVAGENPIFTMCARMGLRPARIVPGLGVTLLAVIAIMLGTSSDPKRSVIGALLLYTLQGLTLLLIGTNSVTRRTREAVETGMMDFHRSSPIGPARLILGFLLGAPIAEYVGAALITPFFVAAAVRGNIPIIAAVILLFAMLLQTWLFHLLAIIISLGGSRSRFARLSTPTMTVFAVMFIGIAGSQPIFSGNPPALISQTTLMPLAIRTFGEVRTTSLVFKSMALPGTELSFFSVFAILNILTIAFLWKMTVRKARTDLATPVSKLQATAMLMFYAGVAMASSVLSSRYALATEISPETGQKVAVLAVAACGICGILAALGTTPNGMSVARYFRQTRQRIGAPRLSIWHDSYPNLIIALVWGGIAFTMVALAPYLALAPVDFGPRLLAMSCAAAFVVGQFGLARQLILFKMARHAGVYSVVVPMVLWIAPLLFGAAFGSAGLDAAARVAFMLSPLAMSALTLAAEYSESAAVIGVVVNAGILLALAAAVWHQSRQLLAAAGQSPAV